jgi:hypothetical protein
MNMRASWFAVAIAVSLLPGLAQAQPAEGPKRGTCFYANQMDGWRAADNKTVFVRANLNRYFRLDMASSCQALLWPDAHLVMNVRGPDTICSAIDWDLKVSNSVHGIPEACIVKTMTPLSPAEAAAIPKQFKP